MSKDDLLSMLELDKPLSGSTIGAGIGIAAAGAEAKDRPPASENAVVMDEWGARRGRDLVAESERLRGAKIDEVAAADFHAVAFDPSPELVASCTDETRHQFLTQ